MNPMSKLASLTLAACLLAFAAAGEAAKPRTSDVPGSGDHPALGRIPGSVILAYDHKAYAAVSYPVRLVRYDFETREAEGEYWRIVYQLPADTAPSGAIAVYRRNLRKAGLKIVWSGRVPLTRLTDLYGIVGEQWTHGNPPRKVQALVAEGELGGRPTVVQVYAYNEVYYGKRGRWGPTARLYIVQAKPLDATLEVVKAEEMASEISAKGRVALYGILFDLDSARIKPESRETLAEIARYLKANPQVKLYVVGHTDNTGTYEYNLDLSRRRAAAVVEALSRGHGVSAQRLKPVGVGPVAPVASNATEEGRAKNRRVELVAQ